MGFGYFNLGSNPRSPLYMVHGFGHVTSPFWVTQPHLPLRIYFSNCLLYSFSSSILPQIHYPLGLLQYRVLCLKHARNIVAERGHFAYLPSLIDGELRCREGKWWVLTGIMTPVGFLIGFQHIPAQWVPKLVLVIPPRILTYSSCVSVCWAF